MMLSHSLPSLSPFAAEGYLPTMSGQHGAARRPSRSGSMAIPAADLSLVDTALVAAMARGEEAAATRLYDRYSAIVYGLALRVTGEQADAEEVVIETFAQAWRDASRFDGAKGSVGAWLTIMARSRALDSVRARQRREKATDSAGQDTDTPLAMSQAAPSADVQLVDAERATAVTAALQSLPESQRQAIELAFFEGLTHPEVAERLREPLGTVKTRIRLGLHKLRDALARLAPEQGGATS